MSDAWQILRDGGLPLATEVTGNVPTSDALARAVRAAIDSAPAGRDADALAAYILAWRQHWPRSFERALAAHADATVDWASRAAVDPNRYLKLRRIALANLAHVL